VEQFVKIRLLIVTKGAVIKKQSVNSLEALIVICGAAPVIVMLPLLIWKFKMGTTKEFWIEIVSPGFALDKATLNCSSFVTFTSATLVGVELIIVNVVRRITTSERNRVL